MTSDSDLNYLKVLEKGPFEPIGWLYESIYEGLRSRQLVFRDVQGYHLSEDGRKVLKAHG